MTTSPRAGFVFRCEVEQGMPVRGTGFAPTVAPARRRFTRCRSTVFALAVAAFTAAGAAQAADSILDRGDTRFLQKAAQSGKLEIDASRLAAERAENPQIKEFAQHMLTDHPPVDEELKALAKAKQVELPAELSRGQSRTLKDLQGKSGADFDARYADKIAVDAHEDAVDLFEDAADDADDADVKAFAAKHLPTLKLHLEMGKALQDAIGDQPRGVAPQRDQTSQAPAPGASDAGAAATPSPANAAAKTN